MSNPNIVTFNINLDRIGQRFIEFSEIGDIYYPLKTNSNIKVLTFLQELFENTNNGFLISQPSHFQKLREMGFDPKNMCSTNVLLDNDSIKYLYDNRVRYFTFDNMDALGTFLEYAKVDEVRVAVRLNITEVFNKFSHLGGSTKECQNMITKLNNIGSKDFGISFYLQKEVKLDENALEKMLKFIISNFKEYPMHFINIAGVKKPKEINTEIIAKIKEELNLEKIILEPGRYLVGDSIDMETSIIKVKRVSNMPVIILKSGIYGGLLDILLYNKQFDIRLKTEYGEIKLENKRTEKADYEFSMCGGSSDSGDRLGTYYINKNDANMLKEGATIVIKSAGAYVEEFFMPLGGDLIKKSSYVFTKNSGNIR